MILFTWGKERKAVQLAKNIINQNSQIKILHQELDTLPRECNTTEVFFLETELKRLKTERQRNIDELLCINPF